MSRADWVNLLYIVGFALFIVGLRMVRGPRTAVRGNQIAAVGMGVALGAWLLHVAALAFAPLSVVQAVLSTGVVILAALADRYDPARVLATGQVIRTP